MRYLIALLLLAGCATAEERAAKQAAYLSSLESRCVALGFTAGTEAAAGCRLQLMQSDRADMRAGQAAAAANQANVIRSMQGQPQYIIQQRTY